MSNARIQMSNQAQTADDKKNINNYILAFYAFGFHLAFGF